MKKILIIDDNQEFLNIYKQLLMDEGFDVSIAKSGTAGIELLNWRIFDLVMMDHNLPGTSGLDVLERIKDTQKFVPTVLMSSDYLPVDANNVRKLGVNAIISKTIDDYKFCEIVKCCLEDKIFESKIF